MAVGREPAPCAQMYSYRVGGSRVGSSTIRRRSSVVHKVVELQGFVVQVAGAGHQLVPVLVCPFSGTPSRVKLVITSSTPTSPPNVDLSLFAEVQPVSRCVDV